MRRYLFVGATVRALKVRCAIPEIERLSFFEDLIKDLIRVDLWLCGQINHDIDLLVSGEGLDRLHKQLIGAGYVCVASGSCNPRDVETAVKIEFIVAGEFPGDGKPKPVAFPAPEVVVERREGIKIINLKSLIELKLASGMTSKGRLQDLADVQRLIQEYGLNAEFSDCGIK